MNKKIGYRGHSDLKKPGAKFEWTEELIKEYMKCKNDIIYFAEHYFKIISEFEVNDKKETKLELIKLRDYQKEMLLSMRDNRFTISNQSRQSGKSETFRIFVTWYILFNKYITVALLANKGDTARELLSKLQISYQALPIWLQLGVTEFNKGSFVLENKSRIIATATTKTAARGFTAQIVILDETAFIDNWNEFYSAVYPIISAGSSTKLIMTSTPNGLNHFYEFWKGATEKDPSKWNGFHAIFVPWYNVPGRDEKWKEGILKGLNYNYAQFEAEFECEFLGSSGTLIGGWKLKLMIGSHLTPINESNEIKLKIYENPIKEIKELHENKLTIYPPHSYMIIADVSRGKGLDYSAFSVIDITKLPYKQVASFRDNNIVPADYAEIILKTAQFFNNAYVLVEINDIGDQIGYMLQIDYGYENLLCTENAGRLGKKVSFGGKKADKGIRTTIPVKNLGCSMLKLMIEQDKLLIVDENTIGEFATFSKDKKTYKAEDGKHDDMVMGLVLFSWLTEQSYFKEMTDINTASSLREMTSENIQSNLLSFGYNIQDMTKPLRTVDEWHHEVNMNLSWKDYVDDPQIGQQVKYDGIIWNVSSPERNNPSFW